MSGEVRVSYIHQEKCDKFYYFKHKKSLNLLMFKSIFTSTIVYISKSFKEYLYVDGNY